MTRWTRLSAVLTLGLTGLFNAGCRRAAETPAPTYPAADIEGIVVDRIWSPHDWSNFDRCSIIVQNPSTQARKEILTVYPDADAACNGPDRLLPGDRVEVHKPQNETAPGAPAWLAPGQAQVTRLTP